VRFNSNSNIKTTKHILTAELTTDRMTNDTLRHISNFLSYFTQNRY